MVIGVLGEERPNTTASSTAFIGTGLYCSTCIVPKASVRCLSARFRSKDAILLSKRDKAAGDTQIT